MTMKQYQRGAEVRGVIKVLIVHDVEPILFGPLKSNRKRMRLWLLLDDGHVMVRRLVDFNYKTCKSAICEWCKCGEQPDESLLKEFKRLEQCSDVVTIIV